ncbi:hypothetical protein [Vogesella indigofera]|uniref:hypothetical protein n=1 Tax=Vogesella indigofera TaxID=45465 RepID=UPI00234F2A8F|nr:hypothetical protein [Vogesella indigofera]MDC7712205.1 hypothetical protein [Vogesella indigofera]
MAQLNAWDYQPTRTSIFFDLHEHSMRMAKYLDYQLQILGQLFVDGSQLTPYLRSTYDQALANEQKAAARFRDFGLGLED